MMSFIYRNKNNSTPFTTCCGVAVIEGDDTVCPECEEEVEFISGAPNWKRLTRVEKLELGLEE